MEDFSNQIFVLSLNQSDSLTFRYSLKFSIKWNKKNLTIFC